MSEAERFTLPLSRRVLSETIGSALLLLVIVGSGIASHRLSTADSGLQLLENSLATALGLGALIATFGPISGGHFNPVVSAVDWFLGRRSGDGLSGREVGAYALGQLVGAILGTILANVIFSLPAAQISIQHRASAGHIVAELVATAGLIAVAFLPARNGRKSLSAAPMAAYVGAAFWFTGSAVFLNPAVTVGRIFTNTFDGIAPSSAPWLVAGQVVGAAIGLILLIVLLLPPTGPMVHSRLGRPRMDSAGRR